MTRVPPDPSYFSSRRRDETLISDALLARALHAALHSDTPGNDKLRAFLQLEALDTATRKRLIERRHGVPAGVLDDADA